MNSTPADRSLRVLVADDNTINLRVATRVLRDMGHSGVLVTDGDKALKAMEQQRFDLVLLDVTMPNRDGLSTLAEIRLREKRGQTRTTVIMVTAHDLPSDRQRMLSAGADGYVAKPLDADPLRAELRRLFP